MFLILGLLFATLADGVDKPFTTDQLTSQLITRRAEKLTGEALVNYVNKHQNLYTAKYASILSRRNMPVMDVKYLIFPEEAERRKGPELNEELPDRFDAREKWPDCAHNIGFIRDQSHCGSCWAVSLASVMTDRLCIQSHGKIKVMLSDFDLLTCCRVCGDCDGGYPIFAWLYARSDGLCTGGPYRTKGVCKPYAFHPCGYHTGQTYYGECSEKKLWDAPTCKRICQRGYFTRYEEDKFRCKSSYYLDRNETEIRKEIMKNGPVQAAFTVYEDFPVYNTGVYFHKKGEIKGAHAVKMIGWGTENGTNYWLIANSWNQDWGGENGFFRIKRGNNECGIENMVMAGMMRV